MLPDRLDHERSQYNDAVLGPSVAAAVEEYVAHYTALGENVAQADYLEYVLRNMTNVPLLPTGKYAKATSEWLPGHLYDPEGGMPTEYGPQGRALNAPLMVILPGPLQRDVRAGRYLSGEAGKIFAGALAANGLRVGSRIYVTGAVKFHDPHPHMASIPAAWAKECLWFLKEEIARIWPLYVLVCGAKPLKLLLGSKAKLYSYRAAVTRVRGVDITATADPYGLSRNTETLPGFEADIRILANRILPADNERREPEPQYHYIRDERALAAALEHCCDVTEIGIDCEWDGESPQTGGRLLTIQFSVRPYESFVVVLWSKVGGYEFAPRPARAIEMLRELFFRPGVRIVGQNFRADLEWLRDVGLDLTEKFATEGFDTLLAAHHLREGDDHDLMALTLRHTTMGRYDYAAQLLLDKGLKHSDLPDEVLHPYAAADTDALLRIRPKLEAELRANHDAYCEKHGLDPEAACYGPAYAEANGLPYHATLWNLFRHVSMPATAPIKEMELEGMPVDQERLAFMTDVFCTRRDEMLDDLRRMVGDPEFNPNSTPQVAAVLFGDPRSYDTTGPRAGAAKAFRPLRLGLTPLKASGKRGKLWTRVVRDKDAEWVDGVGWTSKFLSPSTDSETLAVLADEQHCEFAQKLKDFRTVSTMTKTLLADAIINEDGELTADKGIAAHIDPDGRMRTHISQLTETGRYRSYRVNLQNLPKGKEALFGKIFKGIKLPSVRSIITSPPEGIYIEADYKSAELFTLAYIANDQSFKDALAARDSNGNEISFHTVSMVKFFKMAYTPEEAAAIMEAGGDEAKRLKMLRTASKTVNFGIPYGRSAGAICQQVRREGVDCTPEEAETWVQGYAEGFPDAWAYLKWCREQVHNPGYLVNPYGRHRHFMHIDDESIMAAQEREATNFNIQGTVADSLSVALRRLQIERDLRDMRTRIVLAIHDAILLWVPFADIRPACELLRYSMTEAPGTEVPGTGLRYGVDLEYSTRWNETADPFFLEEVSGGYLDHRPKCKKCGIRILKPERVRHIDLKGRKVPVCADCA